MASKKRRSRRSSRSSRGGRKTKPVFYECGVCDQYHPAAFTGDCRDDANRFFANELDERYGGGGWAEVSMPGGEPKWGRRRHGNSRFGNEMGVNGHWYVVWYGPEVEGGFLKRHASRGFVSHHDAQGLVNKMRPPGSPARRQVRKPKDPISITIEWWDVGTPRVDIVAGRRG